MSGNLETAGAMKRTMIRRIIWTLLLANWGLGFGRIAFLCSRPLGLPVAWLIGLAGACAGLGFGLFILKKRLKPGRWPSTFAEFIAGEFHGLKDGMVQILYVIVTIGNISMLGLAFSDPPTDFVDYLVLGMLGIVLGLAYIYHRGWLDNRDLTDEGIVVAEVVEVKPDGANPSEDRHVER